MMMKPIVYNLNKIKDEIKEDIKDLKVKGNFIDDIVLSYNEAMTKTYNNYSVRFNKLFYFCKHFFLFFLFQNT